MSKKTPPRGKPFKKGNDPRRNTTGANKGVKWKATLLKELMSMDLSQEEMECFSTLTAKFPTFFNTKDQHKNFQLFMELKQLSLVFHENATVSQNAITAIKDRVDGKPVQTNKLQGDKDNPIKIEQITGMEIK